MIRNFALLVLAVGFSLQLHADDQIFSSGDQLLPTTKGIDTEEVTPARVTDSAARALVASGAEVEVVSEDEALARAESHGVTLDRNQKGSPNFGHPWTIIKVGAGSTSAINLLAEIYINDNWTIEPHASLTLTYGALLLGARWHPDKLCWGCKGRVGFTVSPGVEAGAGFAGLSWGSGVIVATSLDSELILRPSQHFMFTVGLRGSAGTYVEAPGTSYIYNPGGPPNGGPSSGQAPNPSNNPNDFTKVSYGAVAHPLFDGLLYIGIGW